MAIYIKGNPETVPNATEYSLFTVKNGEYTKLQTVQNKIIFNLSDLVRAGKLKEGEAYNFVVQASAMDFEPSDYSNVIQYTFGQGTVTPDEPVVPTIYDFTISVTPGDAIVKINGTERKTVSVTSGTTVTWSASKTGYVTQSGSHTVTGDYTLPVILQQESVATYTLTINPNPSTATVTLSATGYSTVSGTGSKSIAVANGTAVNWKVEASGYTTRTGSWTISDDNKTENITLIASGGEVDATRLSSYGDNVTAPSRLASKAYIANVQNSFSRGTTVSYIEFPVAYSTNKVYYTEGNPVTFPVEVWVFDVATNKPVEKLVDGQNFTTSLSTNDNYTCQTIIVPINRTFDYDFYFGYANVPSSNNIALSYGSCAGNYLSGTAFEIGTAITPGQNYGIPCSIYGTGSTYVEPDDVDNMNQVVYYNETASSVMAGNCYVASRAQTIPANTEIKIMDIKVKGEKIQGANVYVVNADTNIIEEMLLEEATQDSIMSTRIGCQVLRLEVNKTYNHPVYFLFNADRPNSNIGMLMKSGVANSILLVDDERKPAVGDDLTDGQWKSGYNIGFAVYN